MTPESDFSVKCSLFICKEMLAKYKRFRTKVSAQENIRAKARDKLWSNLLKEL